MRGKQEAKEAEEGRSKMWMMIKEEEAAEERWSEERQSGEKPVVTEVRRGMGWRGENGRRGGDGERSEVADTTTERER
jgi:hypothetical protein